MKRSLESQLRQLHKMDPSPSFQENTKRRLFVRMQRQEQTWTVRLLKKIFRPLPDASFAHNALQHIMAEIKKPAPSVWEYSFVLLQRYFPTRTLAGTLAVFMVVIIAFQPPVSQANAQTELVVGSGTVEVKSLGRDWKVVRTTKVLQIGDQIRTDNDSAADIYLSDYSVIRVAENTRINIGQILANQEETPLVFKLQEGKIWSNVITKKQDFFVETRHSRVSTEFGSFGVEANGKTTVRSLQNTVVVEPRTADNVQKIQLSAGFETAISDTQENIETKVVNVNDPWLQENQKRDAQFQAQVLEDAKKTAGFLPGSPLYPVQEAVMALRADKFDTVHHLFASSKVLLQIGEEETAYQQFAKATEQLNALWGETDSGESVMEFLKEEKALFAQLLPGDPLFPLREKFELLLITYASNPELEELNQVSEKMLELQNLVLQPEEEDRFVAALDGFIADNAALANEAITAGEKDKLQKLLSLQNDSLNILRELAPTINDKETQKQAALARKELVNTIQNIVSVIAPEQNKRRIANENEAKWFAEQIHIMVEKVETYQTERGRTNTIHNILANIPDSQNSLDLLYALKSAMPEDVHLPISKKILEIRQVGR